MKIKQDILNKFPHMHSIVYIGLIEINGKITMAAVRNLKAAITNRIRRSLETDLRCKTTFLSQQAIPLHTFLSKAPLHL